MISGERTVNRGNFFNSFSNGRQKQSKIPNALLMMTKTRDSLLNSTLFFYLRMKRQKSWKFAVIFDVPLQTKRNITDTHKMNTFTVLFSLSPAQFSLLSQFLFFHRAQVFPKTRKLEVYWLWGFGDNHKICLGEYVHFFYIFYLETLDVTYERSLSKLVKCEKFSHSARWFWCAVWRFILFPRGGNFQETSRSNLTFNLTSLGDV